MNLEKILVARVVAGDAGAEADFYNAMRPRLLRANRHFLGYNDSDVEDVVQETFIIALSKLKDYTFEAPIYAWLRQISLRLCFRRLRTRKRLIASPEHDLEVYLRDLALQPCTIWLSKSNWSCCSSLSRAWARTAARSSN